MTTYATCLTLLLFDIDGLLFLLAARFRLATDNGIGFQSLLSKKSILPSFPVDLVALSLMGEVN